MYQTRIAGVGHYVPENIVTNHDLEQYMDTSDAWITERTGIKERRFFTENKDTTARMGIKAAEQAIERSGLHKNEIDFIIFATLSPDYYFPGSGVIVQNEMGFPNIGALDIRNQCSGFIYGLSVADQFIKTGMYKNILLIGSETQSNFIEFSDRHRNMAVIFGDGAGAVVLSRCDNTGKGILSTHLHAEGKYAQELINYHPGTRQKIRLTFDMLTDGSLLPYMNGNMVFKHAVVRFEEVILEALSANHLSPDDIDLLIPHQANLRISQYIQKRLGFPDEKVFNNIQKYGNTTAASIPIAFSEAWEQGLIQPGKLICIAAFGSGFTWGSALIRM
ncbi:MAG: ketoacyl-ACP synthase III [Flavobacteriales bacterium]|nr:ketoacyl-ACP synthase III [Flavobacteriales bacterium]MCZ2444497.1 ketoacyl-ACP synthase III [Flavobacteriales bacterium]